MWEKKKDVEKLNLYFVENVNGECNNAASLKNNLVVPQHVKYRITI